MNQKKLLKKNYFVILLILFDQLSKLLASEKICNSNLPWGIIINRDILWFVVILSLTLLLYYAYKSNFPYSLLLIMGGALSNILDRLQHRCIIDFISLKKLPIFNLADVFIIIGLLIFLWQTFTKQNTNNHSSNKKNPLNTS